MKCHEFDEKNIIIQNPILLGKFYIYDVKYIYPSKKINNLVIESKWIICSNLSKMIQSCKSTSYQLNIRSKKSILSSILDKINDDLISKKESIITSVVENANINNWKNLLRTFKEYNETKNEYYDYYIFGISNKSVIEIDGVISSLNNLLMQNITECNFKIFFRTEICFNKDAIKNEYKYIISHTIHHMKIKTDVNKNINPDDQKIQFVVEI